MVELEWPSLPLDAGTYTGVHALVAGVAALGGAVGWLEVPEPAETRAWLDGVLGAGGRLVLARDTDADDVRASVVGCGYWSRFEARIARQNAEIRKVMVAAPARGRGLARLVVAALVADAEAHGVEVLTLAARGNNHAALGLYADLGFVTTGRRPDWIAVGQDRFDEVLLHLDLRPRRPPPEPAVHRHGGRREATGRT